jgi:type IV pilus assembly protein PilP
LVALLLLGPLPGCEDTPTTKSSSTKDSKKPTKPAKSRGKASAASAPSTADTSPPPPRMDFRETDFVETEANRDPFRPFDELFAGAVAGRREAQRKILLEEFSVEELRLIGIVSRINPAKAMLVDPRGQGHVVHRGDFVGKAERVQGSSLDQEFELNWRIDRIRDSDVVLVREDPSNPDVPSATRVIALRPEEGAVD